MRKPTTRIILSEKNFKAFVQYLETDSDAHAHNYPIDF